MSGRYESTGGRGRRIIETDGVSKVFDPKDLHRVSVGAAAGAGTAIGGAIGHAKGRKRGRREGWDSGVMATTNPDKYLREDVRRTKLKYADVPAKDRGLTTYRKRDGENRRKALNAAAAGTAGGAAGYGSFLYSMGNAAGGRGMEAVKDGFRHPIALHREMGGGKGALVGSAVAPAAAGVAGALLPRKKKKVVASKALVPALKDGFKWATANPTRALMSTGAAGGLIGGGMAATSRQSGGVGKPAGAIGGASLGATAGGAIMFAGKKTAYGRPKPPAIPKVGTDLVHVGQVVKASELEKRWYDPEHRRQRRLGMAEAGLAGAGLVATGYGLHGVRNTTRALRSAQKLRPGLKGAVAGRKRDLALLGGGAAGIGGAGAVRQFAEGRGRAQR